MPPAHETATAPLRGTQSFVGAMAAVWRRPGLTLVEVLYRWLVGLPFLLFAVHAGRAAERAHPLDTVALAAATVFQPLAGVQTFSRQFSPWLPVLWHTARWLLPAALLLFVVVATAGRRWICRLLEPARTISSAQSLRLGLLGLLRILLLSLTLFAWLRGLAAAARYSIALAIAAGGEPNLVLFTGMAVVLTLFLFVGWSLVVWPLDAAQLFVLAEGQTVAAALHSALTARALRSKLAEINLVMGIVKVALLVLAMVFMATPLPFSQEESQTFLIGWWIFISLLFLMALDYFHVVRRAANLIFFRALVRPSGDTAPPPSPHPSR